MEIEKIPEELKKLKQWVTWTGFPKAGEDKLSKEPCYWDNKEKKPKNARWKTPDGWKSIDKALQDYMAWHGLTDQPMGIGFVLSQDDPYIGVDLDNCIFDGTIYDEAQEIINKLNAYTEYSQSGKGIHVIVKGTLPEEHQNKFTPKTFEKIEIYSQGRFFAFTSNILPEYNYTEIPDRNKEIQVLYAKLLPKIISQDKKPKRTPTSQACLADNETVIRTIQQYDKDAKFDRLMSGDISEFNNDHSAADLALCNIITYYTQNIDQVVEIVKQSKIRDGADPEKYDRNDYLPTITIPKAIAGHTDFYHWDKPTKPKKSAEEPIENAPEEPETNLTAKPISCQLLLDMNLPEPPMIIGKGLLPREGYTLLGGPTKTGKTTFIEQMFLHILSGVDFLGFPIEQNVNILYCFLENTYNSIAKLLKQQIKNFQHDIDFERLNFLEARGLSLQSNSGIEFLTKNIIDTKSELVVIDPVSLAMDRDMNDIATIRTFVRILQKISKETEVGWLLIHHYGKPNIVKRDPIAKVLGSSGFGIYCESFIGIERYSERRSPDYKRLSFKFRHGAEREDLCLYLNPITRLFELVDDPENISAISIDRVVEIMKNHGQSISYTLLTELIKVNMGIGTRTAKALISEAKATGKIDKEEGRHGKYFSIA